MAGRELAAAGVLIRADDIFFLRLGEMEELAEGEKDADRLVSLGLSNEQANCFLRQWKRLYFEDCK